MGITATAEITATVAITATAAGTMSSNLSSANNGSFTMKRRRMMIVLKMMMMIARPFLFHQIFALFLLMIKNQCYGAGAALSLTRARVAPFGAAPAPLP